MADTPKRYRPQQAEYLREWKEKNADHMRDYWRDYMRKKRGSKLTKPPKSPTRSDEQRAKNAAYMRKWRSANKDKVNEQQRQRYAANGPTEGQRRYRALKPVRHQRNLEILAARPRPDRCDVCGGNQGKIVFDHCHKTNHFRGWLCNGCNRALGFVNDEPHRLRMLAAYLDRTKKGQRAQLHIPGV